MKIALKSGAEAEYTLQEPDSFPSTYFFSMERAGSSLFWFIVTDLLRAARRSYCQPLADLFLQGVARSEVDDDALRSLLARPGYAFGMFRSFDVALHELDLTQSKKFLLVRDPRDILVSLYFSMAGSHPIYGTGTVRDEILRTRAFTAGPVGDFVRSEVAGSVLRRFRQYRQLCESDSNVILFRYEDVIFDKLAWATELVRHLDLNLSPRIVRKIATRHDLLPPAEDPLLNVRQVSPGNWRKHLDQEAAAHVEQLFAEEMAFFGYVPEASLPQAFRESLPQFCKAISERLAKAEEKVLQSARESHSGISYRIYHFFNRPPS